MSTNENARIENAKRYLIGLTNGDLQEALSAFSEDASYRGSQMVDGQVKRRLLEPKSAIAAYIGDWLRKASGGITYTIHSAKEWGDCVLIEWSAKAEGDNGATYDNSGILVFEFDEQNRINHARPYTNREALYTWGLPG